MTRAVRLDVAQHAQQVDARTASAVECCQTAFIEEITAARLSWWRQDWEELGGSC